MLRVDMKTTKASFKKYVRKISVNVTVVVYIRLLGQF